MRLKVLCWALLLALAPQLYSLEIAAKRRTPYTVVYADNAADDRMNYISKIGAATFCEILQCATGASFPMQPESAFKGGKAIYYGNCKATAQAGFSSARDGLWDYHVHVKNGNVYLYGRDEVGKAYPKEKYRERFILGSFKAASVFLEQYAGYVPTLAPRVKLNGFMHQDGIPLKTTLTVPDDAQIDGKGALLYSNGRSSTLAYDTTNNCFPAPWYGCYGGHSHPVAVPKAKYFQSHPEYFRMVKGKRDPGNQNQLCLSNPEVQKLIYQELLSHADQGFDMVQLGQSDGFYPCECPECQNLYGFKPSTPVGSDAYRLDPCWGEKLWKMHLDMAKRFAKDRPGKKLSIMAYGPTQMPPAKIKQFPPNVMVELAPCDAKSAAAWKKVKVPGGFLAYLYNWGFYKIEGLMPKAGCAELQAQAKLFKEMNVRGIYRCGFGELMGIEGPFYYVWCKLLENPNADTQELMKKYTEAVYPGAGAEMLAFYQELDKRLALHYQENGVDWNDADLLNAKKALTGRPNLETILIRYPESTIQKLDSLLKAAEKKLSPADSWSLRLTRLEFDYLAVTARAVNAMDQFKKTLSPADWAKAQRALLAREEYLSKLQRKDDIAYMGDYALFGRTTSKQLKDGGRLVAPLFAPFQWNNRFYAEKGVQPAGRSIKVGEVKAQYLVPANFMLDAPDKNYVDKAVKIYCTADEENLKVIFIAEHCTAEELKDRELYVTLGKDAQNMHWYTARFRNGSEVRDWERIKRNADNDNRGDVYEIKGISNATVTIPAPGVTAEAGSVTAEFKIPFSMLVQKPAAGEKWLFNAHYDDAPHDVRMIWEHNFQQSTWRNTRDHQGTLEF